MRTGKLRKRNAVVASAALLAVSCGAGAVQGLTIVLDPVAGTSAQAIAAFRAAADRWEANFTDSTTLTIQIGYQSLGGNILAQAGSNYADYSYSTLRSALQADRTSADDNTAFASLPSGSTFAMLINYTSNNPNGAGSGTPYLDNNGNANNSNLEITYANARSMGLPVGSGYDASITFSTNYAFDFDPTDGVTSGQFDFIGIASHEIGHALGMDSGVDYLDYLSPTGGPFYADSQLPYVTTADLFRFSTDSRAQGSGVIDWTTDPRDKFFSIDGGTTKLASFSTGPNHGDGSQASHWKDNLGIGVMDPTADYGELLGITEMDRRFFDVVGWNRNFTWKWLAGTSGTWQDPLRWNTDGVPDVRVDAVFANAATYGVSFTAGASAKSLAFTAGTVILNGGVNTLQISQGVLVSGGNLTIASGKVQAAGMLSVASGTVTLQGGALKVASLSIAGTPAAPTARIDIVGNGFVIDYSGGIGTQLSDTVSRIIAGQGSFNAATQSHRYDGMGITSSLAGASNALAKFDKFAIGAINNADLIAFNGTGYATFAGNDVDGSSILVRYTYAGDANLDGKIDSADYSLINRAYAHTIANVGWLSGDFNFDGTINASDYAIIDFGYLRQGTALGSDEPTAVPEPGTLSVLGTLWVATRRRRHA